MHVEQKLYEAFISGDLKVIDGIFKKVPRLKNKKMIAGGNWIYSIGPQVSLEVVEYLIHIGLDPHEKALQEGDNALTSAAREGRDDLIAFLLYLGVEIDTSLSVRNPLFATIGASIGQWGQGNEDTEQLKRIIELLLDAGIDPWIEYKSPSMNRQNAAGYALAYEMNDIAEHIIKISSKNNDVQYQSYWTAAKDALARQKYKSPYKEWLEHTKH